LYAGWRLEVYVVLQDCRRVREGLENGVSRLPDRDTQDGNAGFLMAATFANEPLRWPISGGTKGASPRRAAWRSDTPDFNGGHRGDHRSAAESRTGTLAGLDAVVQRLPLRVSTPWLWRTLSRVQHLEVTLLGQFV